MKEGKKGKEEDSDSKLQINALHYDATNFGRDLWIGRGKNEGEGIERIEPQKRHAICFIGPNI